MIKRIRIILLELRFLKQARIKDLIIDECYMNSFERIKQKETYSKDSHSFHYGSSKDNRTALFSNEDLKEYSLFLKIAFENNKLSVSFLSFWCAYVSLLNYGYIVTCHPFKSHFKLTEKGIYHYKNGLSFKQTLINNGLTYISVGVSILALIISIFALN